MPTQTVTYKDKKLNVEFTIDQHATPTTYSPAYGADGGDNMQITIETITDKETDLPPLNLTDEDLESIECLVIENYDDSDDYDDDLDGWYFD